MIEDVVVEPMSGDFILWRCLHGGLLTVASINQWNQNDRIPWAELRARNVPLLRKLTNIYGACAFVARDGEQIVGHMRFYPKAICEMDSAGEFCLQGKYPTGPKDNFAQTEFPSLWQIKDRTLVVHCVMAGAPSQQENPYRRKGIGTRMARELIEWARVNGWQAIEAYAYEDLDILYANTGQAGKRFWEKIGFRLFNTVTEQEFIRENDFVKQMREQALEKGLDPKSISNKYTMRLDI